MSDQPKLLHRILMPDDARLMACPFCGKEASMEGTFALGERRFFVRCLSCHCTSRIAVSEVDALNDWNRRDGLLLALRNMRSCVVKQLRKLSARGYRDGLLADTAEFYEDLDDAALLELAGVGRDVPSPQPAKEAPSVPIAREAHGETTAGTAHGDATPASSFCSQCGQDLSAPACGPTHALRAAELAGVFQAPVVPAGSPGADLPASSSKGGDASGVNDGKTDLHDSISVNEAGADVNAPSAGGVPENTGPATASFLPYAEYAPPIKQAAEPAERMDYAEWEIRLRRHAQIEALLDAARDLREMADERTRQDDGPAAMQILMCVARLEARAR